MEITTVQLLTILGVPSLISALTIFVVSWVVKKIKAKGGIDTILRKAMQAILRQKLLEMHDKYYNRQGWIPEEYKASYDNMYTYYHILGKNGVMDQYYEEVMSLPTTPKQHKKEN